MSVRMKLTHSKTASRRAHHVLTLSGLEKTSSGLRRRHFVDPETGMYRGRQLLPAKKKAATEHEHSKAAKGAQKAKGKAAKQESAKQESSKEVAKGVKAESAETSGTKGA